MSLSADFLVNICCPADFVDTSSVLLPFLLELIVWLFYLQDICSSSYNYSAAQT
jgi:hypothetical protein